MTDQHLTTLAAKAAGYTILDGYDDRSMSVCDPETGLSTVDWSPLDNDADAFRLMIKLRILIGVHHGETWAQSYSKTSGWLTIKEPQGVSAYAATRRAIVKVAAEI